MENESLFLEQMNVFGSEYNLVAYKDISQLTEKSYAHDKTDYCRFCGKDSDETTFKKTSHIFPQFIGNKYAISTYECDVCNEKFSRNIENDFANLMKPLHSVNGIKGVKKIPTYKKNGIRLSTTNGCHFKMSGIEDETITKSGIKCKLETDDFIPIRIYKMLTKMALSIVDENELEYFSKTIAWLMDETDSFYGIESFPLLITQNKNNSDQFNLSVLLAQKKINNEKKTTYVFKLYYGIFSFQIFIPLYSLDKIESMPNIEDFQFIPNTFEMESNSESSYRLIMECKENRKGHISIDLNIDKIDD